MADTQRATKRKRYTSNFVTIEIGEDREALHINEDIVNSKSPFFKAAFQRKWQEGKSRILHLPEDKLDVVAAYLDWLNTGQLTLDQETGDEGEMYCDIGLHVQLYVFGEKIQDDSFCDTVIESLTKGVDTEVHGGSYSRKFPGPRSIRILYEGTPADSPGRRCLVDMYATQAPKDWFKGEYYDENPYPPEFLLDLVYAMAPEKTDGQNDAFYPRREKWFKNNAKQAAEEASESSASEREDDETDESDASASEDEDE